MDGGIKTGQMGQNTTAVLLAGGRSSRMGKPKHLLTLDGQPFWARTLAALRAFDRVAVSVAEKRPEFEGLTQWEDERQGLGPVGALCTAFHRAETPLVQFVTCDAPFVTEELFSALFSALEEHDDCVIPSDGERSSPLLGLYRTRALNAAVEAAEAGERRVRSVLERLRVHELTLPPPLRGTLRNVNTPEDYQSALREGGETP